MDVDAGQLLAIIGEYEVKVRMLTRKLQEYENAQARTVPAQPEPPEAFFGPDPQPGLGGSGGDVPGGEACRAYAHQGEFYRSSVR